MTATTVPNQPTTVADALARSLHPDFETVDAMTRHLYRLEALGLTLINPCGASK